MDRIQPLRRLLACGIATLLCAGAATAQDAFPSRTITLVVGAAAGSGTDIGARLLAKDMAASLGVGVVVDNKPSAAGSIAAQAVARAKADGYTLFIGSATTNAANYAYFPGKLGYGPKSFEPVGGIGTSPLALYVAANAPWRKLSDLVAEAKAKPGKLNCGNGNSTTQVGCEVFRKQAGIDTVQVPYKSNPQSLTDVVGGTLQFAFSDTSAGQTFVENRSLRILAVAAAQRMPAAPDVPTFIELGMQGFEITGWSMVFAPAGIPAPVAEKLNAAIRKSVQSSESMQRRERTGGLPLDLGLADARSFVAREVARWAHFVELSGVKPEQ